MYSRESIHILFVIAATILVVTGMAGCSYKENNAWQEALKTNTGQSYSTFIDSFPQSKHCVEARDKILKVYFPPEAEKNAFTHAVNLDSVYAYDLFTAQYPKSCYRHHVQSNKAQFKVVQMAGEEAIGFLRLKDEYGWNEKLEAKSCCDKCMKITTIYNRDGTVDNILEGNFFIGNLQFSGTVTVYTESMFIKPGSTLAYKNKKTL